MLKRSLITMTGVLTCAVLAADIELIGTYEIESHRHEVREYLIAYFPAAADRLNRQGFLRIVNHSERDGSIEITAFDDSGTQFGPVTLNVDAMQTVHLNSIDLEAGDEDKGLATGVGAPSLGDWRFHISSTPEIKVYAYIRTPDDFLSAMHDVVPQNESVYTVATFNPASDTENESFLRIVNTSSAGAEVSVIGVDDRGVTSDKVEMNIPAHAARTISSGDLENGSADLNGSLGNGTGRWRLNIESKSQLLVMSLLSTPTGHLTNLSTDPSVHELGGESDEMDTDGVPDLVVESVAIDNATPTVSNQITLSVTVLNRGDVSSDSTTVRYYLSSNSVISRRDTEVGSDLIGELEAGATSDESTVITVPSTADTYYYGACVDVVTGENTSNNCSESTKVEVTESGGTASPPPAPSMKVVDARTIEYIWEWTVEANERYAFDHGIRVAGREWVDACDTVSFTTEGVKTIGVTFTNTVDIPNGTVLESRYRYRGGESCTTGSPEPWSESGRVVVNVDPEDTTPDSYCRDNDRVQRGNGCEIFNTTFYFEVTDNGRGCTNLFGGSVCSSQRLNLRSGSNLLQANSNTDNSWTITDVEPEPDN